MIDDSWPNTYSFHEPQAVEARLNRPWLVDRASDGLVNRFQVAYRQAMDLPEGSFTVIIAQQPSVFWPVWLATVTAGRPIALLSHTYCQQEKIKALDHLQPALVYDGEQLQSYPKPKIWPYYNQHILIPTGGSGGQLKWAVHHIDKLCAAVIALFKRLQTPLHSLAPLPLYHVSGLMPGLRAWCTQSTVAYPDFKSLEAGQYLDQIPNRFVSLVPTQLQRLLNVPAAVQALRQAQAIFLGGASCPKSLWEASRQARLPLALSYGMTETAAMISLQDPQEFLAGVHTLGHTLPGTQITLNADNRIVIQSPSLFMGYFPEVPQPMSAYLTDDTGELTSDHQLKWVKRADRIIICGGEKIDPDWLAHILQQTDLFEAIHIDGKTDPIWGSIIVAYAVSKSGPIAESTLQSILDPILPRLYHPKKWVWKEQLSFKSGFEPSGKQFIDQSRML